MNEPRLRYGGLFWRLSASYFVITLATAFIFNYVARFSGPFGDFRDNLVVRWFDQVGSNEFNSSLLFVCLALVVGTLTGVVISFNLTRRLSRITRAAEAWSGGDFSAAARDSAGANWINGQRSQPNGQASPDPPDYSTGTGGTGGA
jgi:hypothetical protein